MVKISACVIVKNEEKNIVQWANKMKKVTDDLIVVDTGSTDKTVERAQEVGAKVYTFPWQDDFSAAKNFAIAQAKGAWIIFLDADEYFTDESIPHIYRYIRKYHYHPQVDAFVCKMVNVDAEDNDRYISEFYNLRMFKNLPHLRYENAVHEELKNKKGGIKLWVIEHDLTIIHTGYSRSIVEKKLQRNLAIIQEEIKSQGERPWHYRYLCDCYYGLKRYEEAEKYARLHIASGMKSLGNESHVEKRLIECMFVLERDKNLLFVEIEQWQKKFPDDPEFAWYKGEYFLQNQFYADAEEWFLEALQLGQYPKKDYASTAFKTRLTQLYCGLGHINRRKNDKDKAAEYYAMALQEYRYHRLAFSNLYALLKQLDAVGIIDFFRGIYDHESARDIKFIVDELAQFPLNSLGLYYRRTLAKLTGRAIMETEMTMANSLMAVNKHEKAVQLLKDSLIQNEKYLMIGARQTKDEAKLKTAGLLLGQQAVKELMKTGLEEADSCKKKDEGNVKMDFVNKTSIVILAHNQLQYTQRCIQSIRLFTGKGSYEIIVVDNHSTDGTVEWLKLQPDLRCIFNERNEGFPKGCNQGIAIAQGTEVLLLNNDTVVTPRWLQQLKYALYSDERVGAVSCMANKCSNLQNIKTAYGDDMEKMIAFAEQYNQSDAARWERRLKLVAFCLLVKRSVIDKIGVLDEQFSPGNYEDDDYSLRMVQAGYTLLLCKDTFIHHFGSISFLQNKNNDQGMSYNALLKENADIFKRKWGLEGECFNAEFLTINIINFIEKKNAMKILQINCGCGSVLLKLQDQYPDAEIYGVESDRAKADIAACIGNIECGDIEEIELPGGEQYYDYIILTGTLETLENPWAFVQKIYGRLKDDGAVLASVSNVMCLSVLKNLFAGHWRYEEAGILKKNHLRFFTLKEIIRLFDEANYKELKVGSVKMAMKEEDVNFIAQLKEQALLSKENEHQVYVRNWLIKANKVESNMQRVRIREKLTGEEIDDLAFLLYRLENGIDDQGQAVLEFLQDHQLDMSYLLDFIDVKIINKAKVIVMIATYMYQCGMVKGGIDLLVAARRLYPKDMDLAYALAFMLNLCGECELALKSLEKHREDDVVKSLYNELRGIVHE